jgi:biopolymer transport protein ExbD
MTTTRPRSARAMYEAYHGPNMTPMVDVVMVILIFFMASAAIMGPEWFLRSALEKKEAARQDAPTRVRVVLLPGGVARVGVDDGETEPMALFQVESRLRDEAASRGAASLVVLVEPAPEALYEDIVKVHDWCARLGISQVGLWESTQGR